ncbi:MAG TPA: AAA family ATPase [Magnetospirillaceae bacterium]|jgi:hypothetical protein
MIVARRDVLRADLAAVSRGLGADFLLDAVLGGNTPLAVLLADHLVPVSEVDLPASWLCWAAASGDLVAMFGLIDALVRRSQRLDDEERGFYLELIRSWHMEHPFDLNSLPQIYQSTSLTISHVTERTRRGTRTAASAHRDVLLAAPSLRVMASIGNGDHGDGREISEAYKALLTPLPLSGGSIDLAVLRVVLLREFPWMWTLVEELIEELLLRRAVGIPWLHFAPRLLVGPPGVGKTRFARRLAQLSGTGFREINAAGSSDNRLLMGTARGWNSTQPALPLMTMRSSGTANPIIVVDEIDKTRAEGRNGDMRATLLAFLESETARAWFDECLLAACDLSQVSWILTANTVSPLPVSLLDRLQIVRIEGPLPIHFDAVLRSVLADFAGELGVTPNELPELGAETTKQLRVRFEQAANVRELKMLVRRALAKSAELIEPVLH